MAEGIVVLPELGNEGYFDLSEAYDVSDDGRVVVGALQASVQGPGDPRPVGFVWVRGEGTFSVDDLLVASGLGPLSIFTVSSVSGNGTRFLATGDPPRTSFDTNSVIVDPRVSPETRLVPIHLNGDGGRSARVLLRLDGG
jgi:hypothetical protein